MVVNVNLKTIHKFWATHVDFTGQNITPERRMVFETCKHDTEYQSHLAKEVGQSPVVVPEGKTASSKRPAEIPLEELDETQFKKNIYR